MNMIVVSNPKTQIRQFIKNCLPPFILMGLRIFYSFCRQATKKVKIEWEFVSYDWPEKNTLEKGWQDNSIAVTQRKKWIAFNEAIQYPKSLGVAHEAIELKNDNFPSHNLVMTFGYILGLVARSKKSQDNISILDWGGGLGHYYKFAKALYSDIPIYYTCKETELLCKEGTQLLPEVIFESSSQQAFSQQYDLVFASCSIHYEENWKELITSLIQSSKQYIYFTRIPIIEKGLSYVVRQRPYVFGYNTEYISWIFNKGEFLEYILEHNVKLLREFLVDAHPCVENAPEQGMFSGFLFEKL